MWHLAWLTLSRCPHRCRLGISELHHQEPPGIAGYHSSSVKLLLLLRGTQASSMSPNVPHHRRGPWLTGKKKVTASFICRIDNSITMANQKLLLLGRLYYILQRHLQDPWTELPYWSQDSFLILRHQQTEKQPAFSCWKGSCIAFPKGTELLMNSEPTATQKQTL